MLLRGTTIAPCRRRAPALAPLWGRGPQLHRMGLRGAAIARCRLRRVQLRYQGVVIARFHRRARHRCRGAVIARPRRRAERRCRGAVISLRRRRAQLRPQATVITRFHHRAQGPSRPSCGRAPVMGPIPYPDLAIVRRRRQGLVLTYGARPRGPRTGPIFPRRRGRVPRALGHWRGPATPPPRRARTRSTLRSRRSSLGG
jgi:hypothetical protein